MISSLNLPNYFPVFQSYTISVFADDLGQDACKGRPTSVIYLSHILYLIHF